MVVEDAGPDAFHQIAAQCQPLDQRLEGGCWLSCLGPEDPGSTLIEQRFDYKTQSLNFANNSRLIR